MAANKDVGVDLGLSDSEKKELLDTAQAVIESRVLGKQIPQLETHSEKLLEKRGAFVTLHKHGMLRGCIGQLQSEAPLQETIIDMAQAAAFNDPRFAPLRPDELHDIDIEISVLTPFELIDDPEKIEVGKHGILLRQGFRSGLLLPQVATERNWDRLTFLEETCRKAGLPKDAWKQKETELYVFSADVFS